MRKKRFLDRELVKRPTSGGKVYQAQNATMKPNHDVKNTRPCTSRILSTGIDRALRLTGLISGVAQRYDTFIMTDVENCSLFLSFSLSY